MIITNIQRIRMKKLTTLALLTLTACGGDAFGRLSGDGGADAAMADGPTGDAPITVDSGPVGEAGATDAAPALDSSPDAAAAPADAAPVDDANDAQPEAACTPFPHGNGVGDSYESCDPFKTYTLASAMQACLAYAHAIGDTVFNCSHPWNCGNDSMVCHSTSDEAGSSGLTCETYCWVYAGNDVGTVSTCSCPLTPKGTWE